MKAWGPRLAACWRYKLTLLVSLPLVFCLGYFALQQFPFFKPRTLPLTRLDRAVAFAPSWFYAYQSLYLFLPIAPLCVKCRKTLDRYALGFVFLCLASFALFLVFPVLGPRPDGPSGVAAFDLWMRYEGRLNAFPSLHAGLLAYTLLFARGAFRAELSSVACQWSTVLALIWSAAILYATLATKQHYVVDLPAGMLLAWLAYRLSFSWLSFSWLGPKGANRGRLQGIYRGPT